ncbi:serine/threonine dehydratase [Kibdelosporangium persicum]|uniref:L-threonine dehydratase catabolic TdcB n=1 Tax=Kibdelosporangium persicum TaxID=2698649 RepID=A0ABX2FAT0_9PSEU|nr:serine/threonine dehydratase [Kibdelosporangium persicum]NRN68328.1 L-threonine dehydratase catabolic TdcB [Kibdelosporangium persicum]
MTDVALAAARIARHARRTPLLRTEIDGKPLVLKLEHLQRTGSFKFRGAVNALLAGGKPDHVVTASGGNHGMAVAQAAAVLDIPATVYAPESIPDSKARRILAAGARLVRAGENYAEAAKLAQEQPGQYVPAYDHPDVIAGQGTVGAEIVADASDVDALVVAVGGGGLAAGTALSADGRKLVTVEPTNCRALHDALAAGTPVDSPVDSIAASALGATRVGKLPFEILRAADPVSVLVDDDKIIAARDLLWESFRLAVEPAAAAPLAAWLAGQVPGDLACLVLCGANTDWLPA